VAREPIPALFKLELFEERILLNSLLFINDLDIRNGRGKILFLNTCAMQSTSVFGSHAAPILSMTGHPCYIASRESPNEKFEKLRSKRNFLIESEETAQNVCFVQTGFEHWSGHMGFHRGTFPPSTSISPANYHSSKPLHTHGDSNDIHFPGRWVGRDGPIPWPPRTPDIMPLDFFL
jgi:hypothetical protein